jgi:hypothetical protein
VKKKKKKKKRVDDTQDGPESAATDGVDIANDTAPSRKLNYIHKINMQSDSD